MSPTDTYIETYAHANRHSYELYTHILHNVFAGFNLLVALFIHYYGSFVIYALLHKYQINEQIPKWEQFYLDNLTIHK